MATKYLLISTTVGTAIKHAGSTFDSVKDAALITAIQNAGGSFATSTQALATAAAAVAKARNHGAAEQQIGLMMIAAACST